MEKGMKQSSLPMSRYVFPKRLTEQLEAIPSHTMTLVEAPSGFGKTTAVREYFATLEPEPGTVRWHTCLGESPQKAWAGICALFRPPAPGHAEDDTLPDDLLELGPPTLENLSDIIALLRNFRCSEPLYLVIDNYQLFEHAAPRKFLGALSTLVVGHLHLIVITQPLKLEQGEATLPETTHSRHHTIRTQDFYFDATSIADHCRHSGIALSAEAAECVAVTSGGWIAAIRLQLKHYAETGEIMTSRGIGPLVETAVWNRLSAAERELMLSLSLLDGFTARQAGIMDNGDALPQSLETLLSLEFFIRYVVDKEVYSLHSILRDYLCERFAMQPQEKRAAMYRKAAAACQAVGDYCQAGLFYMKVEAYEAVLALPFTAQYMYNNREKNLLSLFEQLVTVCPQEALCRQPMKLVLVAYLFFRMGAVDYFVRTTSMLRTFLDSSPAISKELLERARAEFYMLMSFTEYNNIDKMSVYHRKARKCLQAIGQAPRSEVFQGSMPWAVGVASYIAVYWHRSGDLQHELDAMDDCLPIYSELASGHGAGAEHVFRAEASLARGDDVEAEALCYAAKYRAQSAGQTGVCLCAEVVLGHIAIVRADVPAYAAVRAAVEQIASGSAQRSIIRMAELCLAVLDLALGLSDSAPPWLHSVEGIHKTLYAHAVPYGYMIHGQWLLHEHRHEAVRGLAALLGGFSRQTNLARNMNYVLLHVNRALYLAVANARAKRENEALRHLHEALHLALPDRMYLPFALFAADVLPLLPLLGSLKPPTRFPNAARLHQLTVLCRRFARGVRVVRQALTRRALSPREQEVARLAKERLSVDEMAANLRLSANTIKTLLKSVYRKLGVKGKAALKDRPL